jgi:hypothetical protein
MVEDVVDLFFRRAPDVIEHLTSPMFSICASVNTYDPVETSVLFKIFIYK